MFRPGLRVLWAQALDDPFLALGRDAPPLEHGDQDEQSEGADDDETGHDANFVSNANSGPDDPGGVAFDGDEAHTLACRDVAVCGAGPFLVAQQRLVEAHAAFLE